MVITRIFVHRGWWFSRRMFTWYRSMLVSSSSCVFFSQTCPGTHSIRIASFYVYTFMPDCFCNNFNLQIIIDKLIKFAQLIHFGGFIASIRRSRNSFLPFKSVIKFWSDTFVLHLFGWSKNLTIWKENFRKWSYYLIFLYSCNLPFLVETTWIESISWHLSDVLSSSFKNLIANSGIFARKL